MLSHRDCRCLLLYKRCLLFKAVRARPWHELFHAVRVRATEPQDLAFPKSIGSASYALLEHLRQSGLAAFPWTFQQAGIGFAMLDFIMHNKTVLISGAGIAGPTLAFWLKAAGFEPTLIERAPALRTGGYVIDFWGLGYDIVERMGLLKDINRIGYHMRELRIVDDGGRRVTGFGTDVFRELTHGRYVTLGRTSLSVGPLYFFRRDMTSYQDVAGERDERVERIVTKYRRQSSFRPR